MKVILYSNLNEVFCSAIMFTMMARILT